NAPPPPEVAVVTVQPQQVAVTNELPGRVEASRIAQVRARVPGIVQKRVFREGSEVKAGAVLFRIDPAPFKATFASAEASVSRAQANLAQANLKVQRYKPLVQENAISKQEYDDALTAQKQAQADLATAQANRQTASLNLGYATVNAPISGRIGRAQVTEGALVGQGEATPLATIQQIDPVYVNMTQPSAEVLRLKQAMANGQLEQAGKNQAKVTLVLEDGSVYPQSGTLLFSDYSVDESTGAITLRATFPNPNRILLPGMYVRARLEQAIRQKAIVVPQQAVNRGPQGSSVLIVGDDGKVAAREIEVTQAQGDQWVVDKGLQGGERIIVEGLQKAKPGATVKAVPWPGPTGTQGEAVNKTVPGRAPTGNTVSPMLNDTGAKEPAGPGAANGKSGAQAGGNSTSR
ncbi:MAG: efflux RND transporter periplasmic adaptor subunit, partial [Burkholderiaceae bacterium]